MSSARERLQKKLKERKEESRCFFLYEEKGIAIDKSDVRAFEDGERLCIKNEDGSIGFGTYVGTNTLFAESSMGRIKMGTIYTVRREGVEYPAGIDGDPVMANMIGQLKKNGGKKTRKSRKARKRTRRS